jgi:tetratricopeptide (TPR) repeat protein
MQRSSRYNAAVYGPFLGLASFNNVPILVIRGSMFPVKSLVSFSVRPSALAACVALGFMLSGPAQADEYADVTRLLRAGQLAEAGTKADQFLAGKPRDAQMRFLKGVIFTEQAKPNDAIGVFTKLTEDYPELPEPYNNLAVLYAGQSQFDKARAALEMAIRTNPSYATAHENLGDVYAKLASQAYSKALQLDNTNTGVQPKLGMIRELFAPGSKGRAAAATPAIAAATPAIAAAPVPAAPAAPVAKAPVPAPAPVAAAPAAKPPVSAPAAAPAPTPAPAPATSPVAASGAAEQEITAAVQNWAKAWSAKNTTDYFSAYGKDFDAKTGSKSVPSVSWARTKSTSRCLTWQLLSQATRPRPALNKTTMPTHCPCPAPKRLIW